MTIVPPGQRGEYMSYCIAVVDDDNMSLMAVKLILEKEGCSVVPLSSGKDLLKYVCVQIPDLILLDCVMPEMDGLGTLTRLRELEKQRGMQEIPVIFLTGTDDIATESECLELGAMDFIRKPFNPKVLVYRTLRCVDLRRLQSDLESEVEKKTMENRRLSIQIVKALAGAIDAKDTYTNGHSSRVAEYSMEIARRAGFDRAYQNRIYMMGLLHDVGKIGIPDAIINKPERLTDDEYSQIKEHPGKGAKILEHIVDMPELTVGASWHHERYDGKGYPDRLSAEDIPEEARIIAIADAYDAMTSGRSYRSSLSQEKVRSEIEKGRGTQFDPTFADIMLQMIDEDREYQMREK